MYKCTQCDNQYDAQFHDILSDPNRLRQFQLLEIFNGDMIETFKLYKGFVYDMSRSTFDS